MKEDKKIKVESRQFMGGSKMNSLKMGGLICIAIILLTIRSAVVEGFVVIIQNNTTETIQAKIPTYTNSRVKLSSSEGYTGVRIIPPGYSGEIIHREPQSDTGDYYITTLKIGNVRIYLDQKVRNYRPVTYIYDEEDDTTYTRESAEDISCGLNFATLFGLSEDERKNELESWNSNSPHYDDNESHYNHLSPLDYYDPNDPGDVKFRWQTLNLYRNQRNSKEVDVLYNAFTEDRMDCALYIFREAKPQDYILPSNKPEQLNVLTYNTFLFPIVDGAKGALNDLVSTVTHDDVNLAPGEVFWYQKERASKLPDYLSGYDVLILEEFYDDDLRREFLDAVKGEYPYSTSVVGYDSGIFGQYQDGGIIIVSKYQIMNGTGEQLVYTVSTGDDAHARKGVNYAKINKQGKIYHIFGTHTQAGDIATRQAQFTEMRDFIASMHIPPGEPIILGGDLNTNRYESVKYNRMLQLLGDPKSPIMRNVYKFSAGSQTNDIDRVRHFGKETPGELIDHLLYSNAETTKSFNEVRLIRQGVPWLLTYYENLGDYFFISDLSDHHAVYGHFEFCQPTIYVNQAFSGPWETGTADNPFRNFERGVEAVCDGGSVLIYPGNYIAVGNYSKEMTLQAPLGGVVLK